MSSPGVYGQSSVWELLQLAAQGGDASDAAFQTLSLTWLPILNHYLQQQCRLAEAPHPDCLATTLALQVIQRTLEVIQHQPEPLDLGPTPWWQEMADDELNSWRYRNRLIMPLSVPGQRDLRPLGKGPLSPSDSKAIKLNTVPSDGVQ